MLQSTAAEMATAETLLAFTTCSRTWPGGSGSLSKQETWGKETEGASQRGWEFPEPLSNPLEIP